MKKSGISLNNIKCHNRGMVLRHILLGKRPNRSEISQELNLTKTTLTNIVSELIIDGIIEESELIDSENGTQGRKSVLLDISKESPLVCAVMIQRQKIEMALIDLKGNSIDSILHAYGGLISVEELKSVLQSLFEELSSRTQRKIFAIGISAIGPIDKGKGLLLRPQNFFDNDDVVFNVVEFIEKITGLQAFLAHDVACATLAEKLYGNARGKENFLFVSIITGLGVGFYLNSTLFDGENGQNGELGHTTVNTINYNGGSEKNDYVEKYLTNDALLNYAREYYDFFKTHIIFTKTTCEVADFILLAEKGDVLSQLVLKKYCKYLVSAISVLTVTLGIANVYITNTEHSKDRYLENLIEKELNSNKYVYDYQKTTITRSKFGLEASLFGAFAIIIDEIFRGNLYFFEK